MSNSKLVSYTKLSPNHSGRRTHSIDRITPHCVVGQLSAESICGCFTSSSRQASCNYGIGFDGRISLCVEEKNRSWCSSSNANDQRAVTIECASDMSEPYAMNSKVYNSLVNLCTDICKRNGKTKLLWLGDKNRTLNYSPKSNEMVLTVHRWFANKSCPGNWIYARLGDLANQVTAKLQGTPVKPSPSPSKSIDTIAREVIRGNWGNGADRKARLEKAGYNYSAVQKRVDEILGGSHTSAPSKSIDTIAREVIRGDWGNGEDRKARLEKAGYNYSAVQERVNTILGGSHTSAPSKSIDVIAREVIRGDWGNGQDRKNRLTAAGYNYYAVQKKVNELLR